MRLLSKEMSLLLLVLLLATALMCQASLPDSGRPRRCCPYAFRHNDDNKNQLEKCRTSRGCVIRGHDGQLSYLEDSCGIVEDTKRWSKRPKSKENRRLNAEECLGQTFTGRRSGNESQPLHVIPYLMSEMSRGAVLPGLEVSVATESWTNLRFRIFDTDLCQAKEGLVRSDCRPRCVTAASNPDSDSVRRQGASFLYDCEVGFYADDAGMTASTSGHTYRLDACLTDVASAQDEACGSYLFRMPETREIVANDSLVLLDNDALHDHVLKLHLDRARVYGGHVQLVHQHNSTVVVTFPLGKGRPEDNVVSFSLVDVMSVLDSGVYDVVVVNEESSSSTVASFELVPDKEEVKSASVWVTIAVVSFTLVTLIVYFRYLWVRKINKIDPNKLYQDEMSKAPSVLVMTDVENRQHVDIVLKLNAYLKAHCCVSEVYFAMDPHTGITTQADGDPWQWCTEAAAKVSQSPNGFVLILGSPPRNMSLDIYKDFTDNQAFVSTQIMREMDGKRGVIVVQLPYSAADALPSAVPDHLKKRALSLPEDFNQLVCDIHRIGKKALLPCLPIKFIQPEVCDGDLSRASAGEDILSSINALKEKVDLFNQESESLYAEERGGGHHEHEEKVKMRLLDTSALVKTKAGKKIAKDKKVKSRVGGVPEEEEQLRPAPVDINIEANILSLNSGYLDKRDRSDLTDEC